MRFPNHFMAFGGTIFLAAGVAQAAGYQLETTYDTTNFFNSFDFFTEADPTQGFVDYVDGETANREGLAGYAKGGIFMGVDYKTMNPANGRKSVRVTSQKAFTGGLFTADIAHMPGSICGTWPAFWMFGPDWPGSGEIDIIEGVNTQTKNSITLHTKPGCHVTNQGALASTKFASSDCGAYGTSAGCGQHTDDNQNYGDGFNAIGGGVYATEWTSDHIAVWFFPRSRIPQDIQAENPDPSNWGTPLARFVGGDSCNIDQHFSKNQIVFDTTFCGAWAGSPDVWASNLECSALASTCKDYVSGNPAAFEEAFWVLNSIKVYQQGTGSGDQPTKPLPSATRVWTSSPPNMPTNSPPQPTYQSQSQSQSQPQPQHTTQVQSVPQAQPTTQVIAPKPQPSQLSQQQSWNGQAWNGKPQPEIGVQALAQPPPPPPPPAQNQAASKTEKSWSGQAWNGLGWGARKRSEMIAKNSNA